MQLSRASQIAIDQLVHATERAKPADVKYFKSRLEKHVAKLESMIATTQAAQHASTQASRRKRVVERSAVEDAAHMVVIRSGATR